MVAEIAIALVFRAVGVDEVIEAPDQQVLTPALCLSTIWIEVYVSHLQNKPSVDITFCINLNPFKYNSIHSNPTPRSMDHINKLGIIRIQPLLWGCKMEHGP